jgi:hypothetical protein
VRTLYTLLAAAAAVLAAAAAAAPGDWVVAPTSPAASPAALAAVDLADARHGWAVGHERPRRNRPPVAHAQRWDGRTFTTAAVPAVGTASRLEDVDVVSPTLAWAVGSAEHGDYFDTQPIVLRFDGSAWKTTLARLFPAPGVSAFLGVSAAAPDDVWAVGRASSAASGWFSQALVAHYDGAAWRHVPVPAMGSQSELTDVVAVAADDVWAVGFALEANWRTVVLHYDGRTWARVASPNAGRAGNVLTGVTAVSADELWAVGSYDNYGEPLTLRYDGSAWRTVPAPPSGEPGNPQDYLTDVVAVSRDEVWAVGSVRRTFNYGASYTPVVDKTFTLSFDGAAWRVVPSPNPSLAYPASDRLYGVAAAAGVRVAVGDTLTRSNARLPLALSGAG